MSWCYCGRAIELEVYHGVPDGWYAQDILDTYNRMKGQFNIDCAEATEPGAPSWLPERHAWLQYREMLRRVGDGVKAKDSACIEIAIRYIELHYIGSYSGYLRTRFSRNLKQVNLTNDQKVRLHNHFSRLIILREHPYEFRHYLKLWRKIITPQQLTGLIKKLHDCGRDTDYIIHHLS